MKKVVVAVLFAILMAGAAGCTETRPAAISNTGGSREDPQVAEIVYIKLPDGRVLECIRSANNYGSVYDCNWDNPVAR